MNIVHIVDSPFTWYSRLLILISIMLATRRLFNFMRIFSLFSPIVTMLSQVFLDLTVFSTFYLILCLLLSLNWSVLGMANVLLPGAYQKAFDVTDYAANPNASPSIDKSMDVP
jgi:hypothetical protein